MAADRGWRKGIGTGVRPRPLNLEDYRAAAARRLPRVVFDYVDGGAESESTVRANRLAYEQVALRPRGALEPCEVDLRVTVLGSALAMPVLLAPCGMARVVRPAGDLAGARAAGAAGTAFVLSAMSGHEVERVGAESSGPLWFQLYHVGGRARVERAIRRASDAGVSALVVTIDTAVGSIRERDRRNGVTALLGGDRLRALPHFLPMIAKPEWLAGRLRDGLLPPLANVVEPNGSPPLLGRGPPARSLTWAELAWVRERWSGPLVVKGVLTPDDAARAVQEGAQAVVVSNHGGRQLDGAEATLRALPEIAESVGGGCEVLIDGGVRRGTDVLKALALGARAVLVGRPWLYGLAAAGQPGIEGVLECLRESTARNLALLGCSSVAEVGRRHVRVPPDWGHEAGPGCGPAGPGGGAAEGLWRALEEEPGR